MTTVGVILPLGSAETNENNNIGCCNAQEGQSRALSSFESH